MTGAGWLGMDRNVGMGATSPVRSGRPHETSLAPPRGQHLPFVFSRAHSLVVGLDDTVHDRYVSPRDVVDCDVANLEGFLWRK